MQVRGRGFSPAVTTGGHIQEGPPMVRGAVPFSYPAPGPIFRRITRPRDWPVSGVRLLLRTGKRFSLLPVLSLRGACGVHLEHREPSMDSDHAVITSSHLDLSTGIAPAPWAVKMAGEAGVGNLSSGSVQREAVLYSTESISSVTSASTMRDWPPSAAPTIPASSSRSMRRAARG